MARRGAVVRTNRERLTRSEPFEVFTRPQRSWPARVLGLAIRLRAELLVGVLLVALWAWLTARITAWLGALPIIGLDGAPVEVAGPPFGWFVCAGLAVVVLALVGVPMSRRYLWFRALAVMTRHRLRAVCVERRVMNYSGNLPLLLWARPTPVGERVWLLLRAGIDAGDIEHNLSHIASACWAADARVTAHRKVTALVMLDVIRRDPLTGRALASPLGEPAAASTGLRLVPTAPAGDRSA